MRMQLGDSRFEFIHYDVTVPLQVDADVIYTWPVPHPKQYQREPVQTIRTCVYGALNLLELVNRLNVPIFQASTSEVYGDTEVHPA
jgi:UDP-glucuronate decarboxylase